MALQQTQVTFILMHVIIVSESSFRLNVISNVHSLSLSNMIFVTWGRGGGGGGVFFPQKIFPRLWFFICGMVVFP
jgi:hypothetical protein